MNSAIQFDLRSGLIVIMFGFIFYNCCIFVIIFQNCTAIRITSSSLRHCFNLIVIV